MAADRVIGANNALPWHLPEDLKHFKAATMGGCMIMGRKTFDSIGRPLPGRRTIVISRNASWSHDGCETAANVEAAIALAKQDTRAIFIVGGAQIYELTVDLADQIVVTEIDLTIAGDALFPVINPAQWDADIAPWQLSASGLKFRIVKYLRRN